MSRPVPRIIRILVLSIGVLMLPMIGGVAPAGEPPLIVSVTPPAGGTDVDIQSPLVSAMFSEAMDTGSVGGTTFTVSGVSGTVSYDDGSRTATFTPSHPLAEGVTYTAYVSGAVRSAAGVPMGEDYQWHFTTTSNITVIGNGRYTADGSTEPRDREVGPGMQAYLDAFSLSVVGGEPDRISAVTVQPTPEGVSGVVAGVEITDQNGVVKGLLKNPAGEPWVVPVRGIKADGSQWLVRITTRPSLPEGSIAVTGAVTTVEGALRNQIQGEDTTSATITIQGGRPEPRTFTGSMIFPAVSGNFVAVQITFDGDSPLYLGNNRCILRWGDAPGVYPHTAATTRNGSTYAAGIGGLNHGTTYYFEATFSDPDGVVGPNPVVASQKTTP